MQEIHRWGKDRSQDFATMLNQFAGLEVAYHERCRDVWLEVAEQFTQAGSQRSP
jgi:Zn-finger nucleic acid-binding protein